MKLGTLAAALIVVLVQASWAVADEPIQPVPGVSLENAVAAEPCISPAQFSCRQHLTSFTVKLAQQYTRSLPEEEGRVWQVLSSGAAFTMPVNMKFARLTGHAPCFWHA